MNSKRADSRHFNRSARLLGLLALSRPVLTAAETKLTIMAADHDVTEPFTTRAVLRLQAPMVGGMLSARVTGFVKSTTLQAAARQLFIAQLATLMGAPSAPYILVRTPDRLPNFKSYKEHKRGLALFSAQAFDTIERNGGGDPLTGCTSDLAESRTESASLGAAGQFRAWIHDSDDCVTNMVRDAKTRKLCLFDHEMAAPETRSYWVAAQEWDNADGDFYETYSRRQGFGIHADTLALIKDGWDSRDSLNERIAYLDGAKAMARRIHGLKLRHMRPLLGALQTSGLPVPYKMARGLLERRLLWKEAIIPGAARRGFNLGWRPAGLRL